VLISRHQSRQTPSNPKYHKREVGNFAQPPSEIRSFVETVREDFAGA